MPGEPATPGGGPARERGAAADRADDHGAGTARHSLVIEHAMRPLFAYLRAIPTPTGVFAASEDWAGAGGVDAELARRVDRAAGELADLVAGRPAQKRSIDPFTDVPSFEELLRSNGS